MTPNLNAGSRATNEIALPIPWHLSNAIMTLTAAVMATIVQLSIPRLGVNLDLDDLHGKQYLTLTLTPTTNTKTLPRAESQKPNDDN